MADLTSLMNPMAGLLSPEEGQAVMGNGLLNLSGNLLSGSGWQPHPVSFGSVLGQSALPALQAQQQMTGQFLQMKHLKNQLELEQMMLPFKQQAIQELTGGSQQIPQTSQSQSVNTLPPYLQVPNQQNAPIQQNAPVQSQQVNIPGVGYFSPSELYRRGQAYTVLGIPGGAEMVSAALSHDPTLAAQTELAKTQATFPYTAATSFLRYAGRPTVLSPGQTAIPPGAMLPPSAQQVLANALGGAVGGQTPSGTTAPVPTQMGGGTIPTAFGPAPVATGLPLKTAEQEKSFGEANVQMVKDINAKAEQAISDRARNQQMLDILDKGGVSLGPLSGQVAYTKNLMTEILGPDKVPKVDPTNTQEFNKYAYQGAIQVAKQAFGGRISTKEVELTINSMPGNNITEKANRAMLYFSNLQLDRNIAQQSELNKWIDDPVKRNQLERFPSYFNKTFPLAGVRAPQNAVPNMSTGTPQANRTILRTGTLGNKKVIQYSDGSVDYAPGP